MSARVELLRERRPPGARGLPAGLYQPNKLAVCREPAVVRDEGQTFQLSLRHQHAVERIGVMARQGASRNRMPYCDR